MHWSRKSRNGLLVKPRYSSAGDIIGVERVFVEQGARTLLYDAFRETLYADLQEVLRGDDYAKLFGTVESWVMAHQRELLQGLKEATVFRYSPTTPALLTAETPGWEGIFYQLNYHYHGAGSRVSVGSSKEVNIFFRPLVFSTGLEEPGKKLDEIGEKALEYGMEEDEGVLQSALGDPARRGALDRREVVVLQERTGAPVVMRVSSELAVASRIYLQAGLGLSSSANAPIVPLSAGLEQVLAVWRNQPPGSADAILFNVEHTPEGEMLFAWLPLVTPMPAVLRGRRETFAAMTEDALVFVAQVARRLGRVLDLETTRVTFLQVGPTTYAIVRSA